MKIRKAALTDFTNLYNLGLETPELRVSSNEPFMDRDDFRLRIIDKNHVFLVAEEENKIAGFICASTKDADRPLKHRYACIVYLVVSPDFRRSGIATKLYSQCVKLLKKKGITHAYSLADADTQAIQNFLKKNGFITGEKLIWMDRKL